MKARRGFTLVELLVTLSIAAVAVTVVGACLAAGIRVWDRVRTFGAAEGEALLGLSIVRRDIMNGFVFYAAPFDGGAESMSFAGTSAPRDAAGNAPRRELGRVSYEFDARENVLRRTWTAMRLRPEDGGLTRESLIRKVDRVEFRYADARGGGLEWASVWRSDSNLPAAVEMTLRVRGSGGEVGVLREVVVPAVAEAGAERADGGLEATDSTAAPGRAGRR